MTRTTVAIIGAGTMGRGIALTALRHGYDVAVFDVNSELARQVADYLTSQADPDSSQAHTGGSPGRATITAGDSIEAVAAAADVVIETVLESEPVKAEVLRQIAGVARSGALLATNTSTFSIARLAAVSGCGGRLIGMHFFNPAEKMRLVEVVVAAGTPPEYVQRCAELAESLGKTPVVMNDSPGFITSRLGLVLGNEAMRLVATGVAEPAAIDTAMRLGYNHPMGPLELADLVGLDARLNNLNALYPALNDERFRPPQILIDLVGAGHLGRKSGRGFYRYDADGRRHDVPPPALTGAGEQL
ncbi:MAG: 3-hydroxyacyl-CoA dehydrogenase family protein [Streptosporangiaceae bacterium]